MANIYKPKLADRNKHRRQLKSSQVLTVDSLDVAGRGVGRIDNQVVFIEGALPGEQVEVVLREQKGGIALGQISKLLTANAIRQAPQCRHAAECGGCETQHCPADQMLAFKQQAIEQQILHTPLPVKHHKKKIKKGSLTARREHKAGPKVLGQILSRLPWENPIVGSAFRYRRKTRFAIDARNPNNVLLGFRKKASKDVFSLQQCPVLVAPLQALIQPLQSLFQSLSQPGKIGHISLLQGINGIELNVRIVKTLNSLDIEQWQSFAKQHQIFLLFQDSESTRFADEGEQVLYYSPAPGLNLTMHMDDFVQVNDEVNQAMVAQAIQWLALNQTDKLLDLFCGIGNFSLPLAQHCREVVGVEGVHKMVQRAQQNAQLNDIVNCRFEHADLFSKDFFHSVDPKEFNKVLLDPSREGAAETVQQLVQMPLTHLLYVSCNPSTFARDAAILVDKKYRLAKIATMDMFPQTKHTELMALFVPA